MSNEAIVTTPPDVVRTLASSTVLVKASSLVNLDFAGISAGWRTGGNFYQAERASRQIIELKAFKNT
jgi:hypothetical protein